jgi:threonine dehydratase
VRVESPALPTFEDVRLAAARLDGVAKRTPCVTSRALDAICGCRAILKCENFQRGGAFKFRGAYNLLAQLEPDRRKRGVVAFSSGNHAQGVALAARLLGIPATIVMPRDAPEVKLAATRDYGADVVLYDREAVNRESLAEELCAERGATLVPPIEDARIVAGAGTAALELLEESGPLDAIVVPVGGGGLMGGTALAAHGIDPKMAVYGVEPEAGDDVRRSLARGEIVTIPVPATIADGLRTTAPGRVTFALAREHARAIVTVSDDELRAGVRFAFERLKMVVEPSGAAAIAALMFRKIPDLLGKRAGAVISGGNVDAAHFSSMIA